MALMFILTLFYMLCFNPLAALAQQSSLETYIVHVEPPSRKVLTHSEDLESWYRSFLPATTTSSSETPRIIHSYRNVVTGFAARLSPEDVKVMEKKDGFVSARPRRVLSLHTTHSPSFLGLGQNLGFWNSSNYGKGVIIGVLDTGILPNHPSFSDEGMPPPPAKWKGKCELNGNFSCNNKLIGARNLYTGFGEPDMAIDGNGHGTHTASTAAGNFVKGANVFGNAYGTAVGIAPHAHLAIYKVCSASGFCDDTDILAAMDMAVEDGVDVLSISLGGSSVPFFEASIAIGAFSAMQRGILVSCSAGNSGPFARSVANDAPWILTVGASTVDRSIRATALLGNKEQFNGQSLFQPKDFNSTMLPLVYPTINISSISRSEKYCGSGSLNNTDAKGKIVFCEDGGGISQIGKGQIVKDAGGVGMILMNAQSSGYSILAEAHVLPATLVSYADGLKIKAYINSTSRPMATILFKGTVIGDNKAPMVSFFSSRGPSRTSPGILKPDIIGPGVNILAAWPFAVQNDSNTDLTFNIISGTSMSCPHLSGVLALLKSAHPDWSPAAIKSAIMTTADQLNFGNTPIVDETLRPATLFSTGAGHVNPSRASDPGLVYDINPDDYIPYLCGLNYTNRQVGVLAQERVNCSEISSIPEAQLNYPSFSITLGSQNETYTRTVTNVGDANSSYAVAIAPPQGVEISVKPSVLDFSEVNQKMTYQVTFSRPDANLNITFSQGFLKWTSVKHVVQSPISVTFE